MFTHSYRDQPPVPAAIAASIRSAVDATVGAGLRHRSSSAAGSAASQTAARAAVSPPDPVEGRHDRTVGDVAGHPADRSTVRTGPGRTHPRAASSGKPDGIDQRGRPRYVGGASVDGGGSWPSTVVVGAGGTVVVVGGGGRRRGGRGRGRQRHRDERHLVGGYPTTCRLMRRHRSPPPRTRPPRYRRPRSGRRASAQPA